MEWRAGQVYLPVGHPIPPPLFYTPVFVLVGVFFVVVIYPPISVCLTVTCLLSPALCAVSVVILSHSLFYVLPCLSCLIGVSV